MATAPIRPLAWALPYATGVVLKSKIIIIINSFIGVPAVVQWVKNLTAVAEWLRSVQKCRFNPWLELKDLVLLQLRCRMMLWLPFSPWPGNGHMLRVQT